MIQWMIDEAPKIITYTFSNFGNEVSTKTNDSS